MKILDKFVAYITLYDPGERISLVRPKIDFKIGRDPEKYLSAASMRR